MKHRVLRTATRAVFNPAAYCAVCSREGHHLNIHPGPSGEAPPEQWALARLQVALQEMYDMGAPRHYVYPLEEALLDIWGRAEEASIFDEARAHTGRACDECGLGVGATEERKGTQQVFHFCAECASVWDRISRWRPEDPHGTAAGHEEVGL